MTYTLTNGKKISYQDCSGGVKVFSFSSSEHITELALPELIDGKRVKEIGSFERETNLKKL